MITRDSFNRHDRIGHGFFTRAGGSSIGLYESLNCGFGAADDPAAVTANRALAMRHLGLPPEALVTVHQIHSARVITATGPWPRQDNPPADALVTDRPGLCLGILTADCVPVLFADAEAGVIGAAHAGWKGALYGVLEATIAAMIALGATTGRIQAALGPAIQQSSYEIGPEFVDRFLTEDAAAVQFFIPARRPGHHFFDLPGYVEFRLARAHLTEIDNCRLDTAADPVRFFSYRRATLAGEPDYGRLLAAITLRS